ncbi:hypothetical protein [Leptospira sp. GIMC2001]|uniref:hypothetical protein n=1 Tax=Leptospira sp. GIMC2001 TaxID=1513297 RepID=UPI0023494E12|nr:hypothetical protein [Leptospira sp. GIMC2001]WCL49255.1 hypothetical protein O4O04_18475 [Leptospira sp. GIMC2001]
MVENDSEVGTQNQATGKVCACGKIVKEVYQNDLCRECLTERFKSLVKVIDSVRK